MTEITEEQLTIKDLFMQQDLENVSYDPKMASFYCQYIMEGRSKLHAAMGVYETFNEDENFESDDPDEREELQRRLKKEGAKLERLFRKWCLIIPRFDEMVNLALKQRCYAYVEEMVEIADDATDDAVMGATGPTINGRAIRRAELQINTRKFIASKLLPKVFGDKTQMELTGADGADLIPTTFNIQLIPTGNFVTEKEALEEAEVRDGGVQS